MSMTQATVNELREIAEELGAESRKARRKDRKDKFQRWSRRIHEAADFLGDD
jgi:hypothetical protein